jgi:hypothetical protein
LGCLRGSTRSGLGQRLRKADQADQPAQVVGRVQQLDLEAVSPGDQLQPCQRVDGRGVGLDARDIAGDGAPSCRRLGAHMMEDRRRGRNSSHAMAAAGVL